ncbi:MAG: hypothetical protein ACTSRK_19125 [Promethearchaeota archaeon]
MIEGNYNITIIVLDENGYTVQDTMILTVNSDGTSDDTSDDATDDTGSDTGIPGYPLITFSIFMFVWVLMLKKIGSLKKE